MGVGSWEIGDWDSFHKKPWSGQRQLRGCASAQGWSRTKIKIWVRWYKNIIYNTLQIMWKRRSSGALVASWVISIIFLGTWRTSRATIVFASWWTTHPAGISTTTYKNDSTRTSIWKRKKLSTFSCKFSELSIIFTNRIFYTEIWKHRIYCWIPPRRSVSLRCIFFTEILNSTPPLILSRLCGCPHSPPPQGIRYTRRVQIRSSSSA